MNVAMRYIVFADDMVSCLNHGQNVSHVGNTCCLFDFTVLWARVRMGHVCQNVARNPMMPLCFICSSLCFAIHLMDRIDVIASCMMFRKPMYLLKPL